MALNKTNERKGEHKMAKEKLNWEDSQVRETYRHTASHIMAQAVKKLWPEAKLAIGPAIDNGFYYDFDVEVPFTQDDLAKIEKEMQHLAKKSIRPRRYLMPREEAIAYFQQKTMPPCKQDNLLLPIQRKVRDGVPSSSPPSPNSSPTCCPRHWPAACMPCCSTPKLPIMPPAPSPCKPPPTMAISSCKS